MTDLKFNSMYDCVIIGGGPAGLTCAIFMGRYRRRVLVIDAGKPRNYAAHAIHGFLGHLDIKPAELLRKGRDEAERVGVEFLNSVARKIERCGEAFEILTDQGTPKGRRVVLAYGVRDILPEIPDLEGYYGKSIFHCPDCDGYEVTGKRIGVIGQGKNVAGLSLKMLQWTRDVTIFTNGEAREQNAEQTSKLQAEGIRGMTSPIRKLVGADGFLTAVELETGDRVEIDALFFTIGVERSCTLAEELGCSVFDDQPCLVVDEYKQTSVEGVYAIGDLAPGSQLAITSAADGAIAAIAINKTLLPPAWRV